MAERKSWSIRFLMQVVAAAVAPTVLLGCGKDEPEIIERCAHAACPESLECDPGDGVCKCGGQGGAICGGSGTCKEGVCVYACSGVECSGGTTLDPYDCTCKCGGQGGPVCADSQICDPATRSCFVAGACESVACAAAMVCDPADGKCKCDGVECAGGESCVEGACAVDRCAGVNCTGGTSCNPEDGKCHCGGAEGQICSFGETCECPGSAPACVEAEKRCTPSTKCINVHCTGGTTCDPADGKCRCGGPGGPVCAFGQSCDVMAGACLGGDRCAGVECSGGLECDPEDGVCKCGGLNGEVCGENEACARLASGGGECVRPCDPRQQGCPEEQGCYFDIYSQLSYCQVPGKDLDEGQSPKTEGMGCFGASDCAIGFHCQQEPFQPGKCRRYCSVPDGASGCPQIPEAQVCEVLNGAVAGLGACDID